MAMHSILGFLLCILFGTLLQHTEMAYLDTAQFFNLSNGNLSSVTWAHAVNSKDLLTTSLNSNIMMLEADVVIGKLNNTGSDIPIMAHPPANTSDLSLHEFLNAIFDYNSNVSSSQVKKGVKLDFKSIEALETSIAIIEPLYNNDNTFFTFYYSEANYITGKSQNQCYLSKIICNITLDKNAFLPTTAKLCGVKIRFSKKIQRCTLTWRPTVALELEYKLMTYPVWINSDILEGPVNATATPVNPQRFFTAAKKFTNSTLSIGWTTNYSGNETANYSNSHINNMLTTIHTNNVSQSITFPVRASIAAHSLTQMQTLLNNVTGSTLTIWSNDDIIDIKKLNELIITIGLNKTYLDVPNDVMKQIDLTGDGSALKPTIKMICAVLIAALILQL